MTRNQLPEGVGKKIVEALKRQAEADITPLSEPENTISNNIPLTDIQDLPDINLDENQNIDEILNESTIIEEDNVSVLPLGAIKQKENNIIPEYNNNLEQKSEEKPLEQEKFEIPDIQPEQSINVQPQSLNFNASSSVMQPKIQQSVPMQPVIEPTPEFNAQQPSFNQTISSPQMSSVFQNNMQQESIPNAGAGIKNNISIPANVAVLKNLIASLPVGVTKQTGAQIIRQTLEAMGIPMNGVLKEAQEVQEELNSSTRECMLRIQEYKTNILQLEQSVQEYQKNITQINDLVSLFLLTDRK